MGVTCAIYGSYMCYLWLFHVLSVALTCAIYGRYMCYLWQLHVLSVADTGSDSEG